MPTPAPYRSSRVALLGVLVLAICTIPLAFAAPPLIVLLLIPVGAAAYVLRVGTRADGTGITVRTVSSSRTVPWSEVDRLESVRGGVELVTRTDEHLRLPGVSRADAPRIVRASEGGLHEPADPPRT